MANLKLSVCVFGALLVVSSSEELYSPSVEPVALSGPELRLDLGGLVSKLGGSGLQGALGGLGVDNLQGVLPRLGLGGLLSNAGGAGLGGILGGGGGGLAGLFGGGGGGGGLGGLDIPKLLKSGTLEGIDVGKLLEGLDWNTVINNLDSDTLSKLVNDKDVQGLLGGILDGAKGSDGSVDIEKLKNLLTSAS